MNKLSKFVLREFEDGVEVNIAGTHNSIEKILVASMIAHEHIFQIIITAGLIAMEMQEKIDKGEIKKEELMRVVQINKVEGVN